MNWSKRSILLLLLAFPVLLVAEEQPVRVAVFQGTGVGPSSQQLIEALGTAEAGKLKISRITAEEIRAGKLSNVDVLVHPGGSGGGQGRALEEKGRKAIRDFVRGGGGYLGVCGGAYLATNDYQWSLNLIDAKVVDRKHWARGKGEVKLQLSPEGVKFFGLEDKEMAIYYGQGPLLARREWDNPEVPNYESLAIYTTEIAKNGAPQGVMARTSAAIRCKFGKGRVFLLQPASGTNRGAELHDSYYGGVAGFTGIVDMICFAA